MVLPIILSALGSSLAGASMLGGLSPLLAGAIGSGLGTLAQGGDIKDALKGGLLSFAGGSLLGGLGGGAGQAAASTSPAALGAATGTPVSMATGATATPGMMAGPLARPANLGAAVAPPAPAGGTGLFGGNGILGLGGNGNGFLANMPAGTAPVARPMEWAGMSMPEKAMFGVQQGALSKAGLGAMAGAGVGAGNLLGDSGAPDEDPRGGRGPYDPKPVDRSMRDIPANFRPGLDAEFGYFNNPNPVTRYMAEGGQVQGIAQPVRMAEGGLMDMAGMAGMTAPLAATEGTDMSAAIEQLNDKELITAATMAIKGLLPDKESALALGAFLKRNGEDKLNSLIEDVLSGKAETFAGQEKGKVRGPGDGQDDMVPAKLGNFAGPDQDVLLSDGEYIIPADAVSGLGNGSTDAGANVLDNMVRDVRNARTGKTDSPNQLDPADIVPR
jgi:hypothetical protein